MQILTRDEARTRSSSLKLHSIHVAVDLREAENPQVTHYPVTSVLSVTLSVPDFFIDVVGEVDDVRVNGASHPFVHEEDRVVLSGLAVGEAIIEVRARCLFSRTGEGLHRYVDPEDERTYLYTQFEPNDAHRAWPCLDQPDLKARWSFTVIAPQEWSIASNGAQVSSEDHADGSATHVFAETPPLSSYLTAIVAGPWAVIDGGVWTGGASDGQRVDIPLRLMCRRSLGEYIDAEDILNVTRHGLRFFHDRYGMTYPWGTYDQVYVPEYNLGAMENPGCVTFNENFLSRGTLTTVQKQRRANVILHEMCHMWFGDLVTPTWWNDLWLKESFAENQGTSAAAASGEYSTEWANFAIGRKAWAYEQDQLPSTHPIAAHIPDVAAAKTNFDGITYAKGAAVLKQLVAWVGEDAFYRGARTYFERHQFSDATLVDLLQALEDATGSDLTLWRRMWLETAGPSVVRAQYRRGTNGEIEDFILTQKDALGHGVIRPHRLLVSVWSVNEDALTLMHSFDIRAESEHTPIDPDGVLRTPSAADKAALIVVNDDDLTYAISRLDDRSTDTALQLIGTCPQDSTRAVVWASLWNALRDGQLDPRRLIASAFVHARSETVPALRDRLFSMILDALHSYLPSSASTVERERLLSEIFAVLARVEDPDALISWKRFTIELLMRSDSQQGTDLLVQFADEADPDLAWKARVALAARGSVTQTDLDRWLDADPSGHATREWTRASAALPDLLIREQALNNILTGSLSNDLLSATFAGLQASSLASASDLFPVLESVENFWNTHTLGLSLRFIDGGFAVTCDIDNDISSTGIVTAIEQWLHNHTDAPEQLKRLIGEHLDNFQRRIRVQRTWR